MKPLSAMSQDTSTTSQASNATVTPIDLDSDIQLEGSTPVSLYRSTATASTPLAIPGGPKESSEQPGTFGNPPPSLLSRPSITTELEGTVPPIFDGTGGAARRWLKRVELYFFVNQQSSVVNHPLRKIGLTLCWIRGPRVDYWVDKQIDWLMDQAHGRNVVADPWAEFRNDFLQSFPKKIEVPRAYSDLQKLEMKNGDIDEYIAIFSNLADLAEFPLDDPFTLHLFQQGLPKPFAKQCLEIAEDFPKTFAEWCTLARRHQSAKERLKAYRTDGQMRNMDNNDDKSLGTRNRPESRRREGAADVGVNRSAVTEEDKAKYLHDGLCFRCGEQGHISRECPSRRPGVIA